MLLHSALDGQTFVQTMPLSCTKAKDAINSLHHTVFMLEQSRRNWWKKTYLEQQGAIMHLTTILPGSLM